MTRYRKTELRRLAETDYSHKFDDLITLARGSNVAFYPIAVPVLVPALPIPRGMPLPPGTPMQRVRVDGGLGMLASGTDGLMIPADATLNRGLQRMVKDVTAHYLLGYYSSNTKADGKIRTIKVRLKKDGSVVRARPFYRAPSNKEMKAMAAPSKPGVAPIVAPAARGGGARRVEPLAAVGTVQCLRGAGGPDATVVVEVPSAAVDAGRWSDGASLEVIADADNGDTTAMGRGRLPANGRALLRIPVTGPQPPSKVMVRVRATGESLVERLTLPTEPGKLIGDPLGYRSGPRGLATPVGLFEFARDEKVRLDWPLLDKVDSVDARLLDRRGEALKHRVNAALQQSADGGQAVTEIAFNPLGRGDYVVELAATAGVLTGAKGPRVPREIACRSKRWRSRCCWFRCWRSSGPATTAPAGVPGWRPLRPRRRLPNQQGRYIVTGLTKDDFEIYEDGKLQDIERAEFVTFDTWTPEGERKDPRTQQEAYDLAADPDWRVFVIVLDRAAYDMQGQHYLRAPLHDFLSGISDRTICSACSAPTTNGRTWSSGKRRAPPTPSSTAASGSTRIP